MYLRFRRLYEYDDEANAKALTSIRTTSDNPAKERAICILAHILIARRAWLQRLGGPGRDQVGPVDFFPKGLTIDDLEHMLSEVRSLWQEYLAHLTDARIRQVIDYTSSDGKKWSTHVEEVLTHVSLHGAYHRGQIAMLVRNAGGDPIGTDFIVGARTPRD